MDEHPPTHPSQLPPPFDWTRLSPVNDPLQASGLPRPAQMPAGPPVSSPAGPPVGPPTFGAPPPPAATPPSPRRSGGGERSRHPAQRSRVAAAIVSGAAFVGLVGCTAIAATDDGASTTTDSSGTASANGSSATADPFQRDRSYGDESDDREESDDGYRYDDDDDDGYRSDDGTEQYAPPQYSPPDWGGSAAPGSGSAPSSGPSTQSQGS